MILGILDKEKPGSELRQILLNAAAKMPQKTTGTQPELWASGHLSFCSIPLNIETLDEPGQPFTNERQTITLVFQGKIYNLAEIKDILGDAVRFRTNCSGEALVHLYEKYQENFLDKVNGTFTFALWDETNQKLLVGRDRLGIEPLFYCQDKNRLVFGSSLRSILATGLIDTQLNNDAVLQYLLYYYNPQEETLVRSVHKLRPGHVLAITNSGTAISRYWRLSYAETLVKTEKEYCEEILHLIKDAINLRLDPKRQAGVFLSGGTDSSAITSIASGIHSSPLNTFSFRCQGKSYDESYYARLIAGRYNTTHTEVSYEPENLKLISQTVKAMDEPFCDIGIEIATYLLGQSAKGKSGYILTGEGGDELFAGHPVYTADKIAAATDWIPRPIISPFLSLLQQLPDNDQKKNLQVKLKRFAYSMSFPPELLSHRWRIYYTPQELHRLCADSFINTCNMDAMYAPILKYNNEADGKDALSRSLYSDYQTLVGFYLQRLRLLRAFQLENRLPLMDHRLVEYAAKVPSKLKIRGLSDTKYIYRKALEEVLPKEILYNRPKLGHSVPMKNWFREDNKIRQWLREILFDGSLQTQGLFKSAYIQRLFDEHMRKTHNHSHRLWGLVVLNLWLKEHMYK